MWTEEVVEQLIVLYKQHPLLWDPKNKNYKNRLRKDEALREISQAMNLEVVEVERKINVLNTQFRRTHKKVMKMRESGMTNDDIESSIWYGYKLLLFLENRYYPRKGKSILQMMPEQETNKSNIEEYETSSDDGLQNGIKIEYTDVPTCKRARTEDDPIETETNTTYKEPPGGKDECDVYGELLAIKLRKFDERTRYTVMHEIDNLIFRTRMSL